ncbi:MAG: DUF4838 domain-containing protein [Clostridia bacterium]|nr:DUF4838 domain-containing protein [Clostridia bacterium]
MKKFVKLASIVMAAVTAFSLIGCNDSSNSDANKVLTPDGTYLTYTNTIPKVEGTVHERKVGTTSHKIIQGGNSPYVIVLPAQKGNYLNKAYAEFNYFLNEAAGFKMDVISDAGVTYSDDATYISMGDTTILRESGITVDYETLGRQGYQIDTKGKSIFISGKERGCLWGMYDLLGELFGYEMLHNQYYTLDKNVTDLALPDFEIKEVPDFDYRVTSYGGIYLNETAATRMRMIRDSNIYVKNTHSHSSFRMVPPETYKSAHPEWYSNSGRQLCYTAGGDEKSYQELVKVASDFIIGKLKEDLEHELVSMAQQDYNEWCTCDTCKASKDYYGTNAATAIHWTNDVADTVQAWIDENQPGRDITFNMIVYHQTEKAPVKKDENGNYVAIDDSVKLHDNVAANIAPIAADFVSSINDSANAAMKETFESWQALTDQYGSWLYDIVYCDKYRLVPYDTWGNSPDMLRFLKNMGTYLVFPEAAISQQQQSNFDALKQYLWSKLMWDVNLDVTTLINHYIDTLYRDAAPMMKQAYWNMRAELYNHKLLGRDGSCWTNSFKTKYWGKRYLVNQVEIIESAYALIEKYAQADPDYYAFAKDEIARESVGPRYMLVKLYGGTFLPSEQIAMCESVASDIIRLKTCYGSDTYDKVYESLFISG